MATEPLLYPHFLEAAEYTIKSGLRFQFTTNGILLPRYAADIARLKIDRILLSFMGSNAAVHDKVIGIEGSFNKLVEGITLINDTKKRLKQKKPLISINFVITNENYKQLYEHTEALSRLDVDKITISNTQFVTKDMVCLHKAISPEDNVTESSVFNYDPANIDTQLLYQQLRLIFTRLSTLNIAAVPNIKSLTQLNQYYKQPLEFLKGYDVCYYPWRFAHIFPNGDVAVSWRCFSRTLGNIKEKAYSRIWNDAPLRNFRSKIIAHKGRYPTCARCGFLWCSYNM
jgi:MoaA/NifB/PqqE/SkfB family radical SAM enzyme